MSNQPTMKRAKNTRRPSSALLDMHAKLDSVHDTRQLGSFCRPRSPRSSKRSARQHMTGTCSDALGAVSCEAAACSLSDEAREEAEPGMAIRCSSNKQFGEVIAFASRLVIVGKLASQREYENIKI